MRTSLLFSLCCLLFLIAQTHQQHAENIIKGITTNSHIPHEINLIQNEPFSHAVNENKKITKLTLDLSFQILDLSDLQQEPSNLFSLIIQPSEYDPPVNILQLTCSPKENVIELTTTSKQGNLQLFKDPYHSHNNLPFEFLVTIDLKNSDIFSLLSTSDRLTKSSLLTTKPNYSSWEFDKTTKILICGQGIPCYINSLTLWYDYQAENFGQLAQLISSGTPLLNLSPNNNTRPESVNNNFLTKNPPQNNPSLTEISSQNEAPKPHHHQQRMLGICADSTMYYYPDSATCMSSCQSPYHVDTSITSFKACVVPYSSTFMWNSMQVWRYSKQVAEFLAQISNIIYVGDSAGIRAAHSLRVFYYVRYTEMVYPAELQLVNYAWNSHFLPLGFKFEMPTRSQEDFDLDTVPEEFSRYGLVSSFLINFWAELMICSGITVLWMFIKLVECCFYSKTFSTVRYRTTLKIRSIIQNLLLTQLYIVFGDLLFFAVLEYRSLTSLQGLTGFSVLFSAFLLLGMAIGFLLHFLLAGKSSDVHKMVAQNLEGCQQEHEKFLHDYQGNKVLFHDFKPDFSQQCFLLFLIFRDLFCSLMATLLFKDPVAQTTLNLVANATFMAYILIKIPLNSFTAKRPKFRCFLKNRGVHIWDTLQLRLFCLVKNAFHTFQQTIYEVITLTVSISTFILSILDRIEADAVQTKYNLSRLIIGLSLVLPFIISFFMISPILYAIWQVLYKDYQRMRARRKLRQQIWAAEQALPTIAVPDKGYFHSYHQTTYTYNQSYTDRPFLQQQSENNNYNSNVQNYDTTFVHQQNNDTMGIHNDSHPHEVQEGYAMTQPDADQEPEPPIQRALEKKKLYSIAIQEIEDVLSLQKDVSTQKEEILKMMNQVIDETDQVKKIKTPRKSLSPPSKLNKSTKSNSSKKKSSKISPPKLLFTDYILTDDRIKLKKIESAKRAKRIKEAIAAAEKAERAKRKQQQQQQLAAAKAALHKSLSPDRLRTDSTPERSSRNSNKVIQIEKSSSHSPSKTIIVEFISHQKPQGILKNSPHRLAENPSRSRFSPIPTQNTIRNSPIPTQNTLEAPNNSRDTRRDLELSKYRSSSRQRASENNLTTIHTENTIEVPQNSRQTYRDIEEQKYRSGSHQRDLTPIPSQNTIEVTYNSRQTYRDSEEQKYRSASPQKNLSQSPQKASYNNLTPNPTETENIIEVPQNSKRTIRDFEHLQHRSASPQKNLSQSPQKIHSQSPQKASQNVTSKPKKSNIEILKYVDDSRLEVVSVDEGRKSLRDTRTRFRGVGRGMNDTDDYLESVTPKGFSENPRDKFRWSPDKK